MFDFQINLNQSAGLHLFRGEDHREIKITDQGRSLRIQLTDNGPGIPSHLLDDIFTPFFTTKKKGTDIGLNLSQQIIRLHGGELTVHSQPF